VLLRDPLGRRRGQLRIVQVLAEVLEARAVDV